MADRSRSEYLHGNVRRWRRFPHSISIIGTPPFRSQRRNGQIGGGFDRNFGEKVLQPLPEAERVKFVQFFAKYMGKRLAKRNLGDYNNSLCVK